MFIHSWLVTDPSLDNIMMLEKLRPYTKYAFYVRTMTISSEKRNYQSDIIRGMTRAYNPSQVSRLNALSTGNSEIVSMI